nr:15559_t:CDS:2 [Entrophospora candida]
MIMILEKGVHIYHERMSCKSDTNPRRTCEERGCVIYKEKTYLSSSSTPHPSIVAVSYGGIGQGIIGKRINRLSYGRDNVMEYTSWHNWIAAIDRDLKDNSINR